VQCDHYTIRGPVPCRDLKYLFKPPRLPSGSTHRLLYAGKRQQRCQTHRKQPFLLFGERNTHMQAHTHSQTGPRLRYLQRSHTHTHTHTHTHSHVKFANLCSCSAEHLTCSLEGSWGNLGLSLLHHHTSSKSESPVPSTLGSFPAGAFCPLGPPRRSSG